MCILRQAFEVSCFVCQILLICCDSGALATLQSKGRMGNTSSMSHPPFLVSAPLLRHSDNKFISRDNGAPSALGISASLWGFPLRSGDFRFALGISALLWGSPIIPIIPKILRVSSAHGNTHSNR